MLLPLPRYFQGRLGGGHLTNTPSIAGHAAMPCGINGITLAASLRPRGRCVRRRPNRRGSEEPPPQPSPGNTGGGSTSADRLNDRAAQTVTHQTLGEADTAFAIRR